MRQPLAVLVGLFVAAVGGLILGEYPFTGWTPYVAGVLFGLVIAEVVVSIAGCQGAFLGVVCAVLSAGGLAFAVWDDSGYGIRPIAVVAWVGVAIGAVVGGLRGGWWMVARARQT